MLKNFIRDERGEDLIEYGLLAAFVAAIATAVIIADPLGLRTAVEGAYTAAVTALNAM
ncbi:MAG TPA: Flp family type IVb pilin [Candidatus Omnitrophota bacterium]|jgi:Flp pilus assembly pilin Flp|nr:Flp family type IVb pilin [Candidatus Eisenbacteria bacterium]HTM00224.1 Flp family type IVb pilin [Candidatus Omnitrophota bacterium]